LNPRSPTIRKIEPAKNPINAAVPVKSPPARTPPAAAKPLSASAAALIVSLTTAPDRTNVDNGSTKIATPKNKKLRPKQRLMLADKAIIIAIIAVTAIKYGAPLPSVNAAKNGDNASPASAAKTIPINICKKYLTIVIESTPLHYIALLADLTNYTTAAYQKVHSFLTPAQRKAAQLSHA